VPQKLDHPFVVDSVKRYVNLMPLSTTHLKTV
jgi:hypothetical protein